MVVARWWSDHGLGIWVVGCGLGIDVDGAWCVAGNSGLSLFFHSPILSLLSSLFLSLRFCLLDWVLVLVLVLVCFGEGFK